MEKRISFDQFQSVKRVAQACNPLTMKREKIRKQIEKLYTEFQDYDSQISALEAGIVKVTGFRVEQLVKKVIEPGVDANGQPKKTTKYLPTDIVSYDETKKQYVIALQDSVPSEQKPETVDTTTEDTTTSDNNTQVEETEELPVTPVDETTEDPDMAF